MCCSKFPKTDNTYLPSSKWYGYFVAPGIPLIPNLARKPLRDTMNKQQYTRSYAYRRRIIETSTSKSQTEYVYSLLTGCHLSLYKWLRCCMHLGELIIFIILIFTIVLVYELYSCFLCFLNIHCLSDNYCNLICSCK